MFIPHTPSETEDMLQAIGINSLEDLFNDVPADFRFPNLDLQKPLTEMQVLAEMQDYASRNVSVKDAACFLGAGAYHHYIPAAVDSLLRRGEFYTAYTPYQPEISQGTLQAIFEFQTLIANLTGMEVSNASHYDGGTAAAEAGILAWQHFKGNRNQFILSSAVNPQYREVFCSYLCGFENSVIETLGEDFALPGNPDDLAAHVDASTALVLVQYPDFFGRVFDLTALARKVHEAGALLAVAANPVALGLFKTPGEMGADIVIGEGQPLGIPLSFGGPYLGFFAAKKEHVRKISGRLVGETVDAKGQRGYVLTLTAREQHIRREKASSNICTNQGLMALAATIHLSLLGKSGLKQVATLCYQKAHYAAKTLDAIPGFQAITEAPFFHEFVLKCPMNVSEINRRLAEHKIIGGLDLGVDCPELANHMLVCITEMNSKGEIDQFAATLREVANV